VQDASQLIRGRKSATMRAVAEHDPQYSAEVGLAWRIQLKDGIEYMRAAWRAS